MWALTNRSSGIVTFAVHASDTGYVPITGEVQYATIDEVGKAIRSRRFGIIPLVRGEFLGEPQSDKYDIRPLTSTEIDKLRGFGVLITK